MTPVRRSWPICGLISVRSSLNRVDEIVLFKPLTLAEITHIVDLQLNLLRARLAERHIELGPDQNGEGAAGPTGL